MAGLSRTAVRMRRGWVCSRLWSAVLRVLLYLVVLLQYLGYELQGLGEYDHHL